MMQIVRRKAYKARKPEYTIELFRRILNEKLGLSFKEEFFLGDEEFFSCRISIANSNLEGLDIGTNGKGMTKEYALASAYGEFMERIQNLFLISNRSLFYDKSLKDTNSEFFEKVTDCGCNLEYYNAPDEEIATWSDDLRRIYSDILDESELMFGDQLFSGKEVALLPYVDVTTGDVVKLPHQLISANGTASGMCAGNTPFEAIIQGLDEILERFILQRIYWENLSFPTLPNEWFSNTEILRKIKKIENEKHLKFIIKDCSCGIGAPAIGVLILDNNSLKYTFHLGVDPSLITALERCITETYQGFDEIQLQEIEWDLQNRLLNDYQLKEAECFKFRQNSYGHLPISIFNNKEDFPPSLPDPTWAISDENDLKKLISIFKKLKKKVYVRDVSFLEVPAYHIYVPGISGLRTAQMLHVSPIAFHNRALVPSKSLNDDRLREIVTMIKFDPFYHPTRYNLQDRWQHADKDYQLAMLLYTLKEYDDSLKHIEMFLSHHSFSEYMQEVYYHSIRNLIWSKARGTEQVPDLIIFPRYLQESVKAMLDNKGYMDSIPPCPNCVACKVKSGCRIISVFKLVKKLERCYSAHAPSQELLAESFTHTFLSSNRMSV